MNNKENFKKKILYRSSHRGTKEMDILLSTFVNKYIDTFNIHDLEELNKILDIEDNILYNLYFGKSEKINIRKSKVLSLFRNFKI
jgi:antitoxin CptB